MRLPSTRGGLPLAAEIPAPRGGGERSDRERKVSNSADRGGELIAPDDAEGIYRTVHLVSQKGGGSVGRGRTLKLGDIGSLAGAHRKSPYSFTCASSAVFEFN